MQKLLSTILLWKPFSTIYLWKPVKCSIIYYKTIGFWVDEIFFKFFGKIIVKYALHKHKAWFAHLTERELFQKYVIKRGLSFVDVWIVRLWLQRKNPRFFLCFTFFTMVNYLLFKLIRWVYILSFLYWTYALLKYAWTAQVVEFKPRSGLTGNLNGPYRIWAYFVFYWLPILRTYNLLYSILYFNIKVSLRDRVLLSTLAIILLLPFVFVFYIKVGIPVRVLYDSYRYAATLSSSHNWTNPTAGVVGGILNAYLIPEECELQAKRIYKNSDSNWNFTLM